MDNNILKGLADNDALFETVKQMALKKFSFADLDCNLSTESLGEHVKARLQGVKLLNEIFAEIALYKTIKEDKQEDMPAR